MSESEINCELCGEEIYDHIYDGEYVQLDEWLFCEKKGCCYCLKTCFTCGNNGENEFSICRECMKTHPEVLKSNGCKYHEWYVCIKHTDDECHICISNKNYDRYNI